MENTDYDGVSHRVTFCVEVGITLITMRYIKSQLRRPVALIINTILLGFML